MINLLIKIVVYSVLFGTTTFIVLKFNGHKKLIKFVKTIVNDFKTGYNSPQGTSFLTNIRNGLINIRFGIGRVIGLTYEGSYTASRVLKQFIRKFKKVSVEKEDIEESDEQISAKTLHLNSWKNVEFFDVVEVSGAKFYIGINTNKEYILKVNIESLPKLKAPNVMNNIFIDEDNCVWINSKGMLRGNNINGRIDEFKFSGYSKIMDLYNSASQTKPKDTETENIDIGNIEHQDSVIDDKSKEPVVNRINNKEPNEDNIMNIF